MYTVLGTTQRMGKKIIYYVVNLLDMLSVSILFIFYYPRLPKRVWIVSERLNQAQDNGIAFFKYLNAYHPEIASFYLLEEGCDKIEGVSLYGKVLIKNSLQHKLYFLKSEVVAFTEKNMIEPWGSRVFYKYFARFYPKKLKVFLQHGILDKDVRQVYGKDVSDIDLFVTSNAREKAFVQKVFGYDTSEIANVGIARFDDLGQSDMAKEKLILYMPTWRRDLVDVEVISKRDRVSLKKHDKHPNTKYKEGGKKAKEEFEQSQYYKCIHQFLSNAKLSQILQETGYKIVFVTHYMMNELIDNNFLPSNHAITYYSSEQVNIQDLVKRASIFITDYSSIHFDAAFAGNQVLYYQFDQNDFYTHHAKPSYFDYERDGFGEVVTEVEPLIEAIDRLIKNKNQRTLYTKRIEAFFEFKDKKNRQRLYALIQEKLDER